MAKVLDMMRATWIEAGPDAKDIFLIQQLETVLSTLQRSPLLTAGSSEYATAKAEELKR